MVFSTFWVVTLVTMAEIACGESIKLTSITPNQCVNIAYSTYWRMDCTSTLNNHDMADIADSDMTGADRMLTVEPSERITAAQALEHPWVMTGDDELAGSMLGDSLQRMRVFNARRKFKSAINSIIMAIQ